MRLDRDFPIGAQDIDWFEELFVYILDEGLDRFGENFAFWLCYGAMVGEWEVCYSGGAFDLFALTEGVRNDPFVVYVGLPCSPMLEVVERW